MNILMLPSNFAMGRSAFATKDLPYECEDLLLFNHVVSHPLNVSRRWWLIETARAVSSCRCHSFRIIYGRYCLLRIYFTFTKFLLFTKSNIKHVNKKWKKHAWISETLIHLRLSILLLIHFFQDKSKESSKTKNL